MGFFRYILFILFLALFIKLLISYVEKLSISLNDKIIKSQIELGLLSIKDFQKDNYETFIKIIKIYLIKTPARISEKSYTTGLEFCLRLYLII